MLSNVSYCSLSICKTKLNYCHLADCKYSLYFILRTSAHWSILCNEQLFQFYFNLYSRICILLSICYVLFQVTCIFIFLLYFLPTVFIVMHQDSKVNFLYVKIERVIWQYTRFWQGTATFLNSTLVSESR